MPDLVAQLPKKLRAHLVRVRRFNLALRETVAYLEAERRPLDRAVIVARIAEAIRRWPDSGRRVDELLSLAWYELRDGCFTPWLGRRDELAAQMLAGLLRLP